MLQNTTKNDIKSWLVEGYGSRRGFVRTQAHRALYLLGWYRNYQQVEWGAVERLVFVCKGNICRSAYAEAVARSLNLNAISCGIDTHDGKPANTEAIRCAATKEMDLSQHRTTSLKSLTFKGGDLFIAMEPLQIRVLEQTFGNKHMYTLAGLWTSPVYPHIQDPYGTNQAYFNTCFNNIEKSVSVIEEKINRRRKVDGNSCAKL